MFNALSFALAKVRKQKKFQIKSIRLISICSYAPAVSKIYLLSEKSKIQNNMYSMIPFIWKGNIYIYVYVYIYTQTYIHTHMDIYNTYNHFIFIVYFWKDTDIANRWLVSFGRVFLLCTYVTFSRIKKLLFSPS